MKTRTTTIFLSIFWGLVLLLSGCSEHDNSYPPHMTKLFFNEISASYPVWSPLGDTIVFTGRNGYGGDLWTINPEWENLSLLLNSEEVGEGVYALYPFDCSDDGYLLFTDDDLGNIYYIPTAGGDHKIICQGWGPTVKGILDGNYNIAYIIYVYGGEYNGIYLTDIHGSEPTLVVKMEGEFIRGVDWSPDGTMLVYSNEFSLLSYDLRVYDFTSQREKVIYETNLAIFFPRWSPDGEWIAFVMPYEGTGKGEVYIIPAEGGEPERLTYFPYGPGLEMPGVSSLSWSPDGKWIVYDLMWRELWKVYVE